MPLNPKDKHMQYKHMHAFTETLYTKHAQQIYIPLKD